MIGTPLDDYTTLLEEGLVLRLCERFNAINGSVGNGEDLITVPRDAGAGGKGKKKIVATEVSSGGQGDGTKSPGAEGVGGIGVVKQLDVQAEFELHGIVVGGRGAGHNGQRAEGW